MDTGKQKSTEERAKVNLFVKYIDEEFPATSAKNVVAVSGLSRLNSWDNGGWSGKGWSRKTSRMAVTVPGLDNIEGRRRMMMLRDEDFGGLAYDRGSGGVFKVNQRAKDLLEKVGPLLRYEKEELVAAFKEAKLESA